MLRLIVRNVDSPPSYRDAAADGVEVDPAGVSVILAPGFNPFLGIRRAESKSILERMQSAVDLPENLIIAKKSLVNTMSVLYTSLLIVTCIVMVSTEVINYSDPLETFQPKVVQTLQK